MSPKNDNESGAVTVNPPEPNVQRLQVGLRLKADAHSDQPVFSNFTTVQGAPGVVFLDFGFLEPSAIPSIARLAKSGAKTPGSIDGRLACRVVVGLDVARQLSAQLNQHLTALSAPPEPARKTAKAASN